MPFPQPPGPRGSRPESGPLRSGVTLNLFRGCLVATLPADLSGDSLPNLRSSLLDRLVQTRVRQVVLDCAGLEILDPEEFAGLSQVVAMARLLGAECVLAGLRPGIVAALITMDVETGSLRAALDLDEALQLFEEDQQPSQSDDAVSALSGAATDGDSRESSGRLAGRDHSAGDRLASDRLVSDRLASDMAAGVPSAGPVAAGPGAGSHDEHRRRDSGDDLDAEGGQ